jgi:PqqD family protein of HPr-rel-A system
MIQSGEDSSISLWRSNTADCVWVKYRDDYVVFHRPSGKTHFLNAAGYRLLTEILEHPNGTASIAAKLAATVTDGTGSLNIGDVHEMLARFEYLGLVDRTDPQS